MSMKVLIGYDGSVFATDAIDDLRYAGLPSDVEAVILTAGDVWPPTLNGKDPRQHSPPQTGSISHNVYALAVAAMDEADDVARQGVDRASKMFRGWTVKAEASSFSPARALIERAEKWQPNLLVVGERGRSAVAQLFSHVIRGVGSVAQKVVRFAPYSVRIGRGMPAPDKLSRPLRIIVGVDGSSESAMAVQVVAMRQWPAGSEVKVITVLDTRQLTVTPYAFTSSLMVGSSQGDMAAWARRAVDHCAQELRDAGLHATPVVLEGEPKYVLTREADQWPADCIFVGAHGMGRIERFMLGSVSSAIAERAHCSVEVVRHPASFT